MQTVEVLRVRDSRSGLWVIWNHQRFLLARTSSDVCMGCWLHLDSRAQLGGLIDQVRRDLGYLAALEIVSVQTLPKLS